ncbi:MAG: CHASE3 domain-containing protein [Actinocatenispora sp.]
MTRGGLVQRTLVVSMVLALIIGGVFAFLISAIVVQRDAAEGARHTQETLAVANKLQRLVADVETGQRGYALTHRSVSLDEWQQARARIPAESGRLTEQLRNPDNDMQRVRAQRIARSVHAYVHDYSVPVVNASRRGDASATDTGTVTRGRVRIDRLRHQFDVLTSVAERHRAVRIAQAQQATTAATIAGTAGAVVSVALVIAFTIYLSHAILRPVRQGATMAGQLSGGDLSARMPESGVGEVGVLQRSFNSMGASLRHSRDELTRLADEQAALRRVATLVARAVPTSRVLTAVTEEVGRLLRVDGTRLFRYEADGTATIMAGWAASGAGLPVDARVPMDGHNLPSVIQRTGAAARIDDIDAASGPVVHRLRRAGMHSAVGAPITVEARIWGGIVAMSTLEEPFPADAEHRLGDFAGLAATTIANSQAREDLVESRARVVATIDQTRRRVERDLHDGVQQRLVSAALGLRTMEVETTDGASPLRAEIARIADGVGETLDDLREVARGIHPVILTEAGLRAALRALARRTPLSVQLDLDIEAALPDPVEAAAYYVVAEALTNAAKYADATGAQVTVAQRGDRLRVTVSDDGVGGADPARGTGLLGLRDRVESLGGTLVVTSRRGDGTALDADLPVDAAEPRQPTP